MEMRTDALFQARRVGTTGHEIVSPDRQVVGWTVDQLWAAILVALLNRAESDGLHHGLACATQPTGA